MFTLTSYTLSIDHTTFNSTRPIIPSLILAAAQKKLFPPLYVHTRWKSGLREIKAKRVSIKGGEIKNKTGGVLMTSEGTF